MLETCLIELDEHLRRNNYAMKHEAKRQFNRAIHATRELRRELDKCSDQTQTNYGEDSDMLYAYNLMLIDRTGDDDELLFKFYNYLKSFPSKKLLTINDTEAFKHIGDGRDKAILR
jgi:hypothetical protein